MIGFSSPHHGFLLLAAAAADLRDVAVCWVLVVFYDDNDDSCQ